MTPLLYTIASLSREVKVSSATLRTWRAKGWLRPTCKVGKGSERYTMTDFERACRLSLAPEQDEYPLNPEFYDRIASKFH